MSSHAQVAHESPRVTSLQISSLDCQHIQLMFASPFTVPPFLRSSSGFPVLQPALPLGPRPLTIEAEDERPGWPETGVPELVTTYACLLACCC